MSAYFTVSSTEELVALYQWNICAVFVLGFPSIGKVTPTAPVTKSTVAKKKKRAKRPGQTSQWKHEETPLDEMCVGIY